MVSRSIRHGSYTTSWLSPAAREGVPNLLLPWITPQHPPDKHVVSSLWSRLFFELLAKLCLSPFWWFAIPFAHPASVLNGNKVPESLFIGNLFPELKQFSFLKVLTVGALHHADASTLRAAAMTWQSELAHLAKPLLIEYIGGPVSKWLWNSLQVLFPMCQKRFVAIQIKLQFCSSLCSEKDDVSDCEW